MFKSTNKDSVFEKYWAGVGQGRCWSSNDHEIKCWSSNGQARLLLSGVQQFSCDVAFVVAIVIATDVVA